MLTPEQKTILNTHGGDSIKAMRDSGDLPDCPEVNARIAKRIFWDNPHNWTFGPWFFAEHVNAQYRSGQVRVRRVVYPDERVAFTVVGQSGRWCDTYTMEDAKKYLRSKRAGGALVYLTAQQVKDAENDHNWALSR